MSVIRVEDSSGVVIEEMYFYLPSVLESFLSHKETRYLLIRILFEHLYLLLIMVLAFKRLSRFKTRTLSSMVNGVRASV